MDKCAVFVANYRGLDRYYNFIFAGRKFSREENFAGGKFRGRKISRNSIRSGYYFRGRKISRKIQIREYSENFLHAKNWCYTVVALDSFLEGELESGIRNEVHTIGERHKDDIEIS